MKITFPSFKVSPGILSIGKPNKVPINTHRYMTEPERMNTRKSVNFPLPFTKVVT